MIVFITPIKSAQITTSWELLSQLFERSLRSVCNQTSPDFRVIVVCHEKPNIQFSHPNITYLQADFPPPENPDIKTKRIDKGRKILMGLDYAQEFQPAHSMVVDADDCINRHLAEFVNQNPDSPGWFVNKGYLYEEGKKYIYLRPKAFSQLGGTGLIIKYGWHRFLFEEDIYDHKVTELPGNIALKPLPMCGAVYVMGNGENIYLNFKKIQEIRDAHKKRSILFHLRDALQYRWLTGSIRNEFGLYDLQEMPSNT